MTLSDFRVAFFDRYSDHSHEERQKAYLLFWGCSWGGLVSIIQMITRLGYLSMGGVIDYRLSFGSFLLMVICAICGYSIWNRKFRIASLVMLLSLSLVFLLAYFLSLYRFYETGIFTHREFFYIVLVYTAIFHSRKALIIVAIIFTIGPAIWPFFNKPNFIPTINHYVTATLINGTVSLIVVFFLLYFSSLINQRSLDTAEKEIAANKALNAKLDQKVKDRTEEIEEKNRKLLNIENNIKRYLPIQLVNSIKSDSEEVIPKAKRKKLTMFFSDIKDFTQITDAMEPEDMATLLNEYLTEMNIIIDKYDGTLAQVTGDALLVFFGAPVYLNDRDHAARCVNMAIDMQATMQKLERKWFKLGIDESLRIRCGINTGMATVGDFGSDTRKLYTAHGMQVNIAARLEQACDPGGILISHTTWALVNEEIKCTEQGQIDVKGYHKPVRIYSVETN
jgi:class 3 adenylate cyclase